MSSNQERVRFPNVISGVIKSAYLCLPPLVAAASLVSHPAVAQYKQRSIVRTEDYVVFTGADVPSLTGSEALDLHLYSCSRSGFTEVPFQVDKRDSEGRYVFPDEKLRDPMRDGTALDDNDEMVFMVKDAGGRCPEVSRVDGAARGVEIELEDPLDGGRAWVYLFEMPDAGAPSTKDYVRNWTDGQRMFASSDQYEVGQLFGKQYYDLLKLRRPDGSWGEDLFDRQRMGMKARLINGSIPLAIPEQEIRSRTMAVIDGPVRVIRDEMRLVEIKLIGLEYMSQFYLFFYQNGYISPLDVNVPVTLHKLFLDISFYYGMDFTEAAIGSVFKNAANPQGIVLDGKPDEGIDETGDSPYMIVTGPQGSFIEIMALDETLDEMVDRVTYIEEDLSKTDDVEDHPGRLIAGFSTASAKSLRKGNYWYSLYHYYPVPFSEKKVREIMNMIEHPIVVKAKPLAPPRDSSGEL